MCKLIAFVGCENSYKYKYCKFLTSVGLQSLEFFRLTQNILDKLGFYKKQNKHVCTCNLTTLKDYQILRQYCKENDIKLIMFYCSKYNCVEITDRMQDLVEYVESSLYPNLEDLQPVDLSIIDCSVLGLQWARQG